jgi:hypothetical protein
MDNINFIKIENARGRIIGVIAVERGSDEETMIVNSFLDQELPFKKATEVEYATFDADVVKRTGRATFCHMLPEE